eukprot:scaffold73841_cov36-Tisochrysis_lutea.AAC.3
MPSSVALAHAVAYVHSAKRRCCLELCAPRFPVPTRSVLAQGHALQQCLFVVFMTELGVECALCARLRGAGSRAGFCVRLVEAQGSLLPFGSSFESVLPSVGFGCGLVDCRPAGPASRACTRGQSNGVVG